MIDFSRSELLLGNDSTKKLKNSKVAVFGIGGVGSYTVEALARSGIGTLCIVDGDKYDQSNMNRQLYATENTIGKFKVDVAADRIKSINSTCNVIKINSFYTGETDFDFGAFDYIVDAIDSVKSKVSLIINAKNNNVPIISSMGAANKLDSTAFCVADIYDTSVCPLARIMRDKLRSAKIDSLKVVYSKEKPVGNGELKGSVPFVPSVAGLIIAGEVIKDLLV